ncbi:hypothetical protein HDU93_007082 [Gonapodya sp. JEL0774]|nr:hypothetical protein HDU93_007082 [Gonapodya sp. JEL0774]
MPSETLSTEITRMFNIKYPILLAGMNVAAGPELAAAVTNAGGLGVIGGLGYTPENLRKQINIVRSHLQNKSAPFGVDLLLPQVGGNARKTNKDYTGGMLPGLIDVIIQEKTALFVCAVGVPPKWAVDKLHAAGIPIMNMIGAPKHAIKALEVGVDIICAQGGEGGGHTGEIATSILIPKVVDIVKGRKSPLTGRQVPVVAAGGIFDGRSLAMSLCMGAHAVWVGTRFVASVEAGAPPRHKNGVVGAGYTDTIRTIIFTGRPMRVLKNPFILDWEENKQDQIKQLTAKGVLPVAWNMDQIAKQNDGVIPTDIMIQGTPLLMGQVAGAINDILPAAQIVDEMVSQAVAVLKETSGLLWLILFVAYWLGMLVVANMAVKAGDPTRLLYGYDSAGNLCGVNNTRSNSTLRDMTTKPNLYYWDPLALASSLTPSLNLNVSWSVCVEECPHVDGQVALPSVANHTGCKYDVNITTALDLTNAILAGNCPSFFYATSPVVNRCFPTVEVSSNATQIWNNGAVDFNALLNTGKDIFSKAIGDIVTTWPVLVAAVGVSLVMCFTWLIIMRVFVALFVYLSILLVLVGFDGGAVYLYFFWQAKVTEFNATPVASQTDQMRWTRDLSMGAFIAVAIIGGLLTIIIIAMRNRIRIAVQVIKEASRALQAMPFVIASPLIAFIFEIVLVAYTLWIGLFLATAQGPAIFNDFGVYLSSQQLMQGLPYYHLLGFFWTYAFFVGCNQTVIAGSVACWYWTLDKKRLPGWPVMDSIKRTVVYHLGSIALGSLLIGLTQLARYIVLKANGWVKDSAGAKYIQYILACVQCCLACLEKFLKFLSKNAYIEMAIYGKPFCTSAKNAFQTLLRNAFRLIAVDSVSMFVLLIGKLCITAAVAFIGYIYLDKQSAVYQVQLLPVPVAVIALEAFIVANTFLGVYRMAIDTIFLCFCEDCEKNDGSPERPFYMSATLQGITNNNNQKLAPTKMRIVASRKVAIADEY